MTTEEMRVPVHEPFDLRLTVGALRRLPNAILYPLIDGEWRFVADMPSGRRLLGVRAKGDSLIYRGLNGSLNEVDSAAARSLISSMLGAEVDLEPLRALLKDDDALGPLAQRLAGLKPPRFANLWEAFCQIVPFQQVSLSAAVATVNRFVQACGDAFEHEGRIYWGAPTPQRVLETDVDTLRGCGLSGAKARTLRALAQRALAHELDVDRYAALDDDAVIARMIELPGIGRWSAQVALLRGLGRLSVFPAGDSGAARALSEVFADDDDPQVAALQRLEHLGAWRGYLYFLLLGRKLLTQTDDA